jgi:hypothetical protein
MHRILLHTLAIVVLLGCCGGTSRADVLELADGTKIDGKVFKEEGGFLWVKTLAHTEKIASDQVKSRTPGEADVDKYDKLRAAVGGDTVTVQALWELYAFQKDHLKDLPPETAKENLRLLQRMLKRDPENVSAHTEIGDVQFAGRWVKKTDLPRLEAEAAREKLRLEWGARLGVSVEIYEADHFLLVDNTGDKDLAGRGKILDKTYDTLTAALGLEKLWKDRCVIVTIKDYLAFCKAVDGFAAESAMPAATVAAAKDRNTGGCWRHRPYPFQVRWPSSGTEGMWSAIVHNCAHVTIWTMWSASARAWEKDTPPAWVEEGLGAWTEIQVMGVQVSSCMGESAKPKEPKQGGTTDKDPHKKKDPKKNADSLREAANEYKERCKAAMESDEFPPLRQFLTYKVGDLGPPEEGGTQGLVTWLMQVDPEKFKVLIASLAKGGKRVLDEYYRDAYGFELIEDMEKKWRGWVLGEW